VIGRCFGRFVDPFTVVLSVDGSARREEQSGSLAFPVECPNQSAKAVHIGVAVEGIFRAAGGYEIEDEVDTTRKIHEVLGLSEVRRDAFDSGR
jgi:hypothetical protein